MNRYAFIFPDSGKPYTLFSAPEATLEKGSGPYFRADATQVFLGVQHVEVRQLKPHERPSAEFFVGAGSSSEACDKAIELYRRMRNTGEGVI